MPDLGGMTRAAQKAVLANRPEGLMWNSWLVACGGRKKAPDFRKHALDLIEQGEVKSFHRSYGNVYVYIGPGAKPCPAT